MTQTLDIQGEFKAIGVRTEMDGVVHRRVVECGRWEGEKFVSADLSGESDELVELAKQEWTPEVVEAWKAHLQELNRPRPFIIPDRVTSRQFKLQLLAEDLLDDVEAWVAAQGKAIQLAYDNSGTFARDEPMMQAGFRALGFPPEQIDAFFSAASKR